MTTHADILAIARDAIRLTQAAPHRLLIQTGQESDAAGELYEFARTALPALARYALAAQDVMAYARHLETCPAYANKENVCECGVTYTRDVLANAIKETTQ